VSSYDAAEHQQIHQRVVLIACWHSAVCWLRWRWKEIAGVGVTTAGAAAQLDEQQTKVL
jgi:hypothetical protein